MFVVCVRAKRERLTRRIAVVFYVIFSDDNSRQFSCAPLRRPSDICNSDACEFEYAKDASRWWVRVHDGNYR